MHVEIQKGPVESKLVGIGFGVNKSDVLFHIGDKESCFRAADARGLSKPTLVSNPYFGPSDFKRTTFAVGDDVVFIYVDIDYDKYTIGREQCVTMQNTSRDRVHTASFYVPKNSPERIGRFDCSSQCGFHRTGYFYCHNNTDDLQKMYVNINAFIAETYVEYGKQVASQLSVIAKMTAQTKNL